jgi:outer membrane protein
MPRKDSLMLKLRAPFLTAVLVLLAMVATPAGSKAAGPENLKIGVVDMNKALNESAAGARSKNILLTAKNQKENELKAKEQELIKLRSELQTNIMLTAEAKARKEQEMQDREQSLRREVQKAQQELQSQERKLTESIFLELKTVLDQVAKEGRFDLVLEQNASQVILYHKAPFIDITDKVIEEYNKFQKSN